MNDRPVFTSSLTFGLSFVTIGTLALLHELGTLTFSWTYLVPALLIIAGIGVMVSSRTGESRR